MSARDSKCKVFLLVFNKTVNIFLFLFRFLVGLRVLSCLNPIIIPALQAELTPEQASCLS